MALDRHDHVPSRSQSESSSDDSDSQEDSDDMRTPTTDSKGNLPARKANDDKLRKAANKDPNRIKRKKARRACENCQRAHLTCSKSSLHLAAMVTVPEAYAGQVISGLARGAAIKRFAKTERGRRQSTWQMLRTRI